MSDFPAAPPSQPSDAAEGSDATEPAASTAADESPDPVVPVSPEPASADSEEASSEEPQPASPTPKVGGDLAILHAGEEEASSAKKDNSYPETASDLADTSPFEREPAAPVAADVTHGLAAPDTRKQKWSRRKTALVALVVILLLGAAGGGIAAFARSTIGPARPPLSMRLTSVYDLGSLPIGAAGTSFQVSGWNFSSHAAITILLDGEIAPGSVLVRSDSQGRVTSTLTVTNAWPLGKHTVTARDAPHSVTVRGVPILIVASGVDKTPGPNNAPTNSASGTIAVTISAPQQTVPTFSAFGLSSMIVLSALAKLSAGQINLVVFAGADHGTVCGNQDDGKKHTLSHTPSLTSTPPYNSFTLSDTSYVETFSTTCSGTYQRGHLTYTKTLTSYTVEYSIFVRPLLGAGETITLDTTCSIQKSFVATHLEGTFSSAASISGSYSSEGYTLHCTASNDGHGVVPFQSNQPDLHIAANKGTWTGIAAMRDPSAPVVPSTTASTTPTASTCFLNPSGPSVPAVYQGSATPTAGPATAPKLKGTAVALKDGLQYVDIKVGSGPAAKSGSTVTVNYTGWLASTCQKFDSSYDRQSGQSAGPFSVQLGQGEVIKGWDEGVVGMKAGGVRRLSIPAALAYGDQGSGSIPAHADLIFDVQVVSIR